jgi:hypothetical protein
VVSRRAAGCFSEDLHRRLFGTEVVTQRAFSRIRPAFPVGVFELEGFLEITRRQQMKNPLNDKTAGTSARSVQKASTNQPSLPKCNCDRAAVSHTRKDQIAVGAIDGNDAGIRMRWPSETATEPTFRSDNPELCPGLIPSRLILAIKVMKRRFLPLTRAYPSTPLMPRGLLLPMSGRLVHDQRPGHLTCPRGSRGCNRRDESVRWRSGSTMVAPADAR